MRGITTIFSQKKWVFAYACAAVLIILLKQGDLTGAEFMLGFMALVPVTLGVNSFDKSQWRTK